MKTRIVEKVIDRRLRHVIQRRSWFRWHDVSDHPGRYAAVVAKFNVDHRENQNAHTHA